MNAATSPIFTGRIENGRPILKDPDGFRRLKESLEGKDIEIRLSKLRKPRSNNQNAYLHAVVLPMIAECCGYDRSELEPIKDALKAKFLPAMKPDAPGDLQLVPSTSALSTEEMETFLEDCRRWAAETLHLVIPDPQHCT